jgi:hypothetical protein
VHRYKTIPSPSLLERWTRDAKRELGRLMQLLGNFADDAAGDLGELGQIVAQILRLVVGVLHEVL